jgi:hypothetical protein
LDEKLKEQPMEWKEINMVIEAFDALIAQYRQRLEDPVIDEDERADISNDLAYAKILRSDYDAKRDALRSR